MIKLIIRLSFCFILLISNNALFAQSRQDILNEAKEYAPLGLSLINLSLSASKVDNDIILLVNQILPDILNENIDKATNDAMLFLYKKTGKSFFDPNIKIYISAKFRSSLDAAETKNYPLIVSNMIDFVLATDSFIKDGIIPYNK